MPVLAGSLKVPPGSHEKILLRCSVVAYGLQRKPPVIRVSNEHRLWRNALLSSSTSSQPLHDFQKKPLGELDSGKSTYTCCSSIIIRVSALVNTIRQTGLDTSATRVGTITSKKHFD
jgi:hypothetical protein